MYDIVYWIYTSVFGLIYGRESFSQNCEATALRSAIKKIRHATYENAKNSSLLIQVLIIAPLPTVPTRLAVKIKC